MRLRLLPILIVAALVLVPFPTDAANASLATSFSAADGKRVADTLFSNADVKSAADRVAPFHLTISFTEGDRFDYDYASGALAVGSARSADFTLSTTRDLALSVLNADEGFHVLACALHDNAATITASNAVYGASLNAAKGRIAGATDRCHPTNGMAVSHAGRSGTLMDGTGDGLPRFVARMGGEGADLLVFNDWVAPTAWIPAASVHLCDRHGSSIIFSLDPCDEFGMMWPSVDEELCVDQVANRYIFTYGWDAGDDAGAWLSMAAESAACGFLHRGVS